MAIGSSQLGDSKEMICMSLFSFYIVKLFIWMNKEDSKSCYSLNILVKGDTAD